MVWQSNGQDGSGYGVYAQMFDSSASKVGAEFRVNTNTIDDQRYPTIVTMNDGGFLISWSSVQNGDTWRIFCQRYDSSGNQVEAEFQVNTNTSGDQVYTSIAILNDISYVIAWGGADIHAQRYSVPSPTISLVYPISDFSLSNFQSIDFTVPISTFYNSRDTVLEFSAKIKIDGRYKDIPDDSWLSFDPSSRKFSGSPPETQTYEIQVLASDSSGYAAAEFNMIVVPNTKPVLNSHVPNQVVPFSRDQIWRYSLPSNTFKDLEGDPIVYPIAKLVVNDIEKDLNEL